MKRKETYVIVKRVKTSRGNQDIVLVDSHSEIWELDNKSEAQNIADILTKNSDSGWLYFVRTIKEKQ